MGYGKIQPDEASRKPSDHRVLYGEEAGRMCGLLKGKNAHTLPLAACHSSSVEP